MKRRSEGFTLIELSITLVIISLITGSVLLGKELITAAQIRSTAKQLEQFNTAYTTFFLTYGCLPGDCAYAKQFGFRSMTITVSDARSGQSDISDYLNPISSAHAFVPIEMPIATTITPYLTLFNPGLVADYVPASPQTVEIPVNGDGNFTINSVEESMGAHVTLSEASMIKNFDALRGSVPITLDVSSPLNGHKAFLLLFHIIPQGGSLAPAAGHYYTITATAIPGNAAAASLTGAQGYALDSKIDDGFPLTGFVRSTGNTVFPSDISHGMTFDVNLDSGANRCIVNGQYNVALGEDRNVLALCTTQIRAAL